MISDKIFPGLSDLNRGDTLLRVLEDVSSKEFLEAFFTNEAFKIGKKLKSFLIGNFRECIIWTVSL